MWKIIALLAIGVIGPFAIWGGTTLALREDDEGSSAGILPPGGLDEFDVNGQVTIDLGPIFGPIEKVPLTGTLGVERSEPVAGQIDIEIVALSLTGTSNLLGPNTPVVLSLNPNGGAALGVINASGGFPAESFFDLPFADLLIGDFEHFLQQSVNMSSGITGVPFNGGDKFSSGAVNIPIQDALNPSDTIGFLTDLNIDIKPPEKAYVVTVLKRDKADLRGIPGWEINLFDGPCADSNANIIDSGLTDDDGLIEFSIANPGSYSVEEKSEPGWNAVGPFCEDVDVPGTAGAVAGVPPCSIVPNDPPPAAGCDEFNSVASVRVVFTNPPSDSLDCDLGGPTLIERSAVNAGTLDTIDTELVAMNLTGTCDGGASVTVRQSTTPSLGQIVEQQNAVSGELDFSADSFFDIYFEVDTPLGTLHNQDPLHLACKIQSIPPFGCFYEPDVGVTTLYDASKKEVGQLIHAQHIPLDPKKQLVIFTNERKETPTPTTTPPEKKYIVTVLKRDKADLQGIPGWEINLYDGPCSDLSAPLLDFGFTDADGLLEFSIATPGSYSVEEKTEPGWNPVGPICEDVDVPNTAGAPAGVPPCPVSPNNPPPAAGCDEFNSAASVRVIFTNPVSDSLDCDLSGPTLIERGAVTQGTLDSIATEIIALDLSGTCDGGATVSVRQSSEALSLGEIVEQQNNVAGELEFKANSYFDVFFEVDTPIGTLHNQDGLHLECKIQQIPPYGCFYEPDLGVVTLYDASKKEVGQLVHAQHIPLDPKKQLVIFTNEFKGDKTYADMSVSIDVEPTDDECTGIKGEEPKIDDGEGVAIEVCVEINDVSAGGYSGWDVLLEYDDDSWTVDQEAGVETIGPCQTFSGALKSSGVQGDGLTGSIAFGCQSDTPSTALGPIASLVFISKKKGNLTPEFQDFTLLPKGSIDPVTDFAITGSSVFCETLDLGKHKCDNLELGFGSVLVTPQGTGNGDVSCDGITNSIDSLFILQFIAALLGSLPCEGSGDVNLDLVINAIDSTLVLQFDAGFLNSLPVGPFAGTQDKRPQTFAW